MGDGATHLWTATPEVIEVVHSTTVSYGTNFLDNTLGSKKLDTADLKKYAPNIVEGVSIIKEWSNSL